MEKMKYTVQRPTIEWIQVEVENANSLEHALELADEVFKFGEYEYVDNTFAIDYYRYWVKDENYNAFSDEDEANKEL